MKLKVWQEIKSLSKTELEVKLKEAQEELFRLKFQHATTPVKNPLRIRGLRRLVAKIVTLLKQQDKASKAKKDK